MELKDIMAISGHSGLFKFVSQARHGVIVESLADGKRMSAPATAKISTITDIAIYTNEGEKPLREVLLLMREQEKGGKAIEPKSDGKNLKSYFEKVLPEYDHERVYISDIKKVITWYNQLQALNHLHLLDVVEAAAQEQPEKAETSDTSDSQ